MPFADPEQRREHMREWRKKAIRNGYGKWLYQKRKRVYTDAQEFKIALKMIANMPTSELNPDGDEQAADSMQTVALDALAASKERWDSLGPAPGMGEPPTKPDDELLETLEKLETSN